MRQTPFVRIGSWNLQGRWDERHHGLLEAMRCDVLLLTEVSEKVAIPGMEMHKTTGVMAPRRRWSAVASRRRLQALDDPHGASAMAEIDGIRFCSSVLPWRSCGTREPWTGSTTEQKTTGAVARIEAAAPVVWGGDWNHAMSGREWSGSLAGRRCIVDAVDRLGLQIPTAAAPHQIDGLLSIDHIAIPRTWTVLSVEHYSAFDNCARLSDHDAYVIEVS